MKKKIAILGSTGSIGKSTIDIIKKDKKNFEIILLTTNSNHKELIKQVKEFNVKNIVINNNKSFKLLKKKLIKKKINIYSNFDHFKKINRIKMDYTMCAISGLAGLKPTLDSIKFSKKIAIANKESIICAWNLIKFNLKKYKTKFIPIDSEHFSIWSILNEAKNAEIDQVIITASGGPFLNLPLKNFKKINPKKAINHPNWKMGSKISVDSATMMNKVFEVIEAQRIFDIDLNKFRILIHSKSYVHAIVKFINGLIKILVHDTDMKIPIFNSLYDKKINKIKTNNINLDFLNNLNFIEVDKSRFPSTKILKLIPKKISLFETVLVSANDELVDLFLDGKIEFNDIYIYINKILGLKTFVKYKSKSPKNYKELIKLSNYVRLKTKTLCI
ncbi:1-deoxy-D-xylulose-5-phosphate reductoisomerase [Candidatus Pelagibacter sp.]|nr:1-deoxy-D-xylulose-5-phosphate reductoisomerase [Candidatus Pelagibacter sp.]